jgi:Periplasmic binding protein-like domain
VAMLEGGGERPDALVCANDQMAIGALRALAARGIRVPDDIAVVGFDDIFPASLCDPPLTTVSQPMRTIGERACERLIERIVDPSLRSKVELLPTELVLRSSCGCPPGTAARRVVPPVSARRKGVSQACCLCVATSSPGSGHKKAGPAPGGRGTRPALVMRSGNQETGLRRRITTSSVPEPGPLLLPEGWPVS